MFRNAELAFLMGGFSLEKMSKSLFVLDVKREGSRPGRGLALTWI